MIREMLIMALIVMAVWGLHGMDVQYYALTSPAMFEWSLMITLLSVVGIGIINMIDLRVKRNGLA
jgi:hypothetical protein